MQTITGRVLKIPVNRQLEFRCKGCGRLLFKGFIQQVEIKCPRCAKVQTFTSTR